MIKVDGGEVILRGDVIMLATELSLAISALYEDAKEAMGEEAAMEFLALIGRVGVMSEKEIEDRVAEMDNTFML